MILSPRRTANQDDYAKLPDMDAPGVAELSETDLFARKSAGGALLRRGLNRSFGLTHLHRHLELREGEVLIRRRVGSEIHTRPEPLSNASGMHPVAFQITKGDDDFGLIALEYDANFQPEADVSISQDDVNALGRDLEANGKLKRFGIGCVRDEDLRGDGYVLSETTYTDARVMISNRFSLEESQNRVNGTFWTFEGTEDEVVTVVMKDCCWLTPSGHYRRIGSC